jgi:hypothetical protein
MDGRREWLAKQRVKYQYENPKNGGAKACHDGHKFPKNVRFYVMYRRFHRWYNLANQCFSR